MRKFCGHDALLMVIVDATILAEAFATARVAYTMTFWSPNGLRQ